MYEGSTNSDVMYMALERRIVQRLNLSQDWSAKQAHGR